jgi:superfamily II DNA/RNA helicase
MRSLDCPFFVVLVLVWQTVMMRRAGVSAWNTAGRVRKTSNMFKRSRFMSSVYGMANPSPSRQSIVYPPSLLKQSTHLFSAGTTTTTADYADEVFDTTATFESIGVETPILLERIAKLGLKYPTKVQAESFSKIKIGSRNSGNHNDEDDDGDSSPPNPSNIILGSETGSGKTLAYLLPLLDDILTQKRLQKEGKTKMLSYDYSRAIILVPNKELVQQFLRMAVPLCGGPKSVVWSGGVQLPDHEHGTAEDCPAHERVRLAVLPGGLVEPLDFKPFRDSVALGGGTEPPVDIIVSTPAALGPLGLKPKHIDMFADVETLVVDEADMLLDGGYIRPLENVLMGFRRADRLDPSMGVPPTQHVFCAATLPDMGLKSVDAYLQRKFPRAERVQMLGMHNARHYGLKQATQWIGPVETKKERMDQLIEMLETPTEQGGLLEEKVMVFLNSVEDVEGAQSAFDRAGVSSVPYHAKISLEERSKYLDQFRRYKSPGESSKGSVPVLVCTDLASRGLDVPGVSAVVQLQFSGNVVSHLHRMGRCGRAGQRTGRGIVFYTGAEEQLVKVVREAEEQQERMVLEGDVDDQLDDEEETGTVKKAFSRKRGFTKKRKKLTREDAQS